MPLAPRLVDLTRQAKGTLRVLTRTLRRSFEVIELENKKYIEKNIFMKGGAGAGLGAS